MLVYPVPKENKFTCPGEASIQAQYIIQCMKQLTALLETQSLVTIRCS